MASQIVSGHYHRTRVTVLMRAKRRRRTVGKDNTGIGLNSQIVRMKFDPLIRQYHNRVRLTNASFSFRVIQYHPISSITGEVLSRTIKPLSTKAGPCMTCDVIPIRMIDWVVSQVLKLISRLLKSIPSDKKRHFPIIQMARNSHIVVDSIRPKWVLIQQLTSGHSALRCDASLWRCGL